MRVAVKRGFQALCGVVLMGVVAGANAQTQTFSGSVPLQTTELVDKTIVLPKFNPALGTLLSVEVSFSINGQTQGTVTNTAAQAQFFQLSNSVLGILSTAPGGSGSLLNTTINFGPQTYPALAPNTPTAYGPFTGSSSVPFTAQGTPFTPYIGPGNITLFVNTISGQNSVGGGGNVSTVLSTQAGATASIRYTYQPSANVPEPGMLGFLASGMVGTGAMVLRRRRK